MKPGKWIIILGALIAMPALGPFASADGGNGSSSAPAIPTIKGLSCPFQLSQSRQNLQNQLTAFLKQVSEQLGKTQDCSAVKSRIHDLSSQIEQSQVMDAAAANADSTASGSVPDPTARLNQELLAENMTFALSSRCTSALKDPTPLIYTSLFLANNLGTASQLTAGIDASAMLLVELGKRIAAWLSKPPEAVREMNRDNLQQDFLNRLCILYLYDHEVDNTLESQKSAAKTRAEEVRKARLKLRQINEQIAMPVFCEDCDDADNSSLKGQLKSLQSALHQITGDSALVDSCDDIRDTFDRGSNSFRTIDQLASGCAFSDSCSVRDDGKISLTQADFCGAWCGLKSRDLALNFNCDDATDDGKRELRTMENRARTVLQYVLAEGGAAKLDKSAIVQYQELLAKKKKLEASLKKGPDPDEQVQEHESDPRLRDKVAALSEEVLGSDMPTYLRELSGKNKQELSELKRDVKRAQREMRKKHDPASACPLVQRASSDMSDITDRLDHYSDLCTYLGNKAPALPYKDPSLSLWDESRYLRSFCGDLGKRRQRELSDADRRAFRAQLDSLRRQACTP